MTEPGILPPDDGIVEQIVDQAARAVAAGKPLLILVFYQHETEKINLIQSLQRGVSRRGLCGRPLDPRHRPEHGIGSRYPVLARDANDKTLSLIVEFPRRANGVGLDPAFLEYLNLHRDKIAAERLRMVLFIPDGDAEQFIISAGDLWDFRHHTYWLEHPSALRGSKLWQTLDQSAAILPVPAETREAVTEHMAQIRSLMESTEDTEDKAAQLLDMARWLNRRHLNDLAAATATDGLALMESRNQLVADLHHLLGFALNRTGHLPEALGHYEESLSISREIGDRANEGITLNNIATIYKSWGRYDDALKKLEESLNILREIGNLSGEAVTCWNLALEWERRGELAKAIDLCRRIVEIDQETTNPEFDKGLAYLKKLEARLRGKDAQS